MKKVEATETVLWHGSSCDFCRRLLFLSTYFRFRKYLWYFFLLSYSVLQHSIVQMKYQNAFWCVVFGVVLYSILCLFSSSSFCSSFCWRYAHTKLRQKVLQHLWLIWFGLVEWRLASKYDSIFCVFRCQTEPNSAHSGFPTGSLHWIVNSAHKSDCQPGLSHSAQQQKRKKQCSHGCNLNAKLTTQKTKKPQQQLNTVN